MVCNHCRQSTWVLSFVICLIITFICLIQYHNAIIDNIDKLMVNTSAIFNVDHSSCSNNGWMNDCYCKVNCTTGTPCEYLDEVDLRIIVMTYNRDKSLHRCLEHVMELHTLGDKISVEIWIDRNNKGNVNNETLRVANNFVNNFSSVAKKGRACVHTQQNNAYISGQWMFSWRPKPNSKEMGLILEDDIIISPLSYKWLKMVHRLYGKKYSSQLSGYTLTMETVSFFTYIKNTRKQKPWIHPSNESIFLYPILGTNGYSPLPNFWRGFQDWYLDNRPTRNVKTDKIKPYVNNIIPNDWYRGMEARSYQESMWEMWHIKYSQLTKAFTIYSNLLSYANRKDVLLCSNLKQKGLHYNGPSVDNSQFLLRTWNSSHHKFPSFNNIIHYNYDGSHCTKTCCFSNTCT